MGSRYKTLWNTERPGYRGIHNWVERRLGKPSVCSNCHTIDSKRYHWANISGEYKRDISDWVRLCVSCHFKKDSGVKTHYKCGHSIKENKFIYPSGKHQCRVCKNLNNRLWRQRQKEKIA